MKLLKERKTPLQSKRKVVAMMNLFEKYVDEKIVVINVLANGNIFDEIAIAPPIIYGDYITEVMKFEVIGNIHANPEIILTKDKIRLIK